MYHEFMLRWENLPAGTCRRRNRGDGGPLHVDGEEGSPAAPGRQVESELLDAARRLGIGPMGSRGINAVIALNIETAVTHTAALPVAFNAQCLVGRRWMARITGAGTFSLTGEIA